MAHSLFEPAPEPLSERLWRRMKALGGQIQTAEMARPAIQSDPALVNQASRMDARGRQQLLQTLLATKPIK